MPKLKSVRRERFAVEVASMTPYASAYVASGYADSPWAAYNASKLAHIPEVAARIEELQTEYRARSGIKLEYLQAQLLRIIEGRPHANPTRAHEVATKITLDAEGKQRVEVDRMTAISLLLKSIGAFSDGVNVSVAASAAAGTSIPPDLEAMSDLDIARRMAFLLAKAAPPDDGGTSVRLEHAETVDIVEQDETPSSVPTSVLTQPASDDAQRHAAERQLSLDISGEPQQVAAEPPGIRFAPLPPLRGTP